MVLFLSSTYNKTVVHYTLIFCVMRDQAK